jgi:hypothetical protein
MRLITATILLCALLLSCSWPLLGAEPNYERTVEKFIHVVGKKDRKALADLVAYPLHRKVPLSTIHTPSQFLEVFDEVLDKALLKAISTSSVADDWSKVGWRGIMFQNGVLWLDEDGKIIAVNYETEKGKRKRDILIEADRKNLHSSLQQFLEPVLEWRTKDFRIRIDRLTDDKYRYAVWPAQKGTTEKPDLVLNNGEVFFDGSGGNHHYDFVSGAYVYRCFVFVIGADDTPPGELEVYKHNKVILNQPVEKVITGW